MTRAVGRTQTQPQTSHWLCQRMASPWPCVALILLVIAFPAVFSQYQPTWESLDTRPLPSWYDEGKLGIFMHWGVYSVPGFGSEWFWYYWRTGVKAYVNFMKQNYPPNFTYADFARDFKAEFFDPNHWADILGASGAK